MFAVFREVLDFFLKAAARYVTTPEGMKEWQDIKDAAEGVRKVAQDDLYANVAEDSNIHRDKSSVPGRVRSSGESGGEQSSETVSKRSRKRV